MTIKLVDDMEDFRDVPIVLNSINYSDDYEGSFDEEDYFDYNEFTVKAYIFGPVGSQAPIKKAKADIHRYERRCYYKTGCLSGCTKSTYRSKPRWNYRTCRSNHCKKSYYRGLDYVTYQLSHTLRLVMK